MLFTETKLSGAFIVEPELFKDVRGHFARTWSQVEFAERGLNSLFVESNVSFNRKNGTLRGMHFQRDPHAQIKLVRCARGAIYDVIVDLRADSPTFKQWIGVELTADNYKMLYVPGGFAHGFQTLKDAHGSALPNGGSLRTRKLRRRSLERSCVWHRVASR